MQEAEEDDGYSDDDLDDLPSNTFQQLQQDAIQFSQKVVTDRPYLPANTHPGDLIQNNRTEGLAQTANSYQVSPRGFSSDYGDFEDDEMLDGEVYDAAQDPPAATTQGNPYRGHAIGESTQREIWRQERFSVPQSYNPPINPTISDLPPMKPPPNNARQNSEEMTWSPVRKQKNVITQDPTEALQAQIQQLLQEKESLRNEAEAAKASALAKTGEIAIVRAKQSKLEKEFEQKMTNLQKSHADEATRQKLAIENARAEKHTLATEKSFLEFDLAQQKTLRTAARKPESPLTTPSKNRTIAFADGFEDNEISVTSPSKLTFRTKVVTPKAGAKRKRKAIDASPAKPLELSQSRNASFAEPEHPAKLTNPGDPVEDGIILRKTDERYEMTQEILNHRPHHDTPRTFESLADFSFPSKADEKLSTLLLDKISYMSSEPFSASVALEILSMWQQCIDENYLEPIHLIMDLVFNLLFWHLRECTPDLTDVLVPLAQVTADINLIPRHWKKPASELSPHVSTTLCLQILHTVAHNVLHQKPELDRFWHRMRFDFTGMILKSTNPIPELLISLSLLKTSVLPNSFSMIIPPGDGDQQKSELVVLDLLSRLLVEMPWVREGEDPYPDEDICSLRLEVLALMNCMLGNEYGGRALARSLWCLPRLIRFICDEIDALYDFTTDEMNEMHSDAINTGFLIWHHVQEEYGTEGQNLQERLKEMPGMIGKQLIVLTRLAFCEGGFYEGRIREELPEMAHGMLEEVLTLEEGEEIGEVMGSMKSRS